MQLGQALVQSACQHGQRFPDVNQDGTDDRLEDPDHLAQTATLVEQQRPGLLSQLLDGGAPPPAGGWPSAAHPQVLARAACWETRWRRASSEVSRRRA